MTYRAVLFDLDGTLLDTLGDIGSAVNDALAREGFPTHPIEAYREFIGDGVVTLVQRALPSGRGAIDDEAVARCVAGYRSAYEREWNVRTRPYEGIPALLDALASRGVAMGVLSNKPDDFTQLCVSEYLSAWPFRVVFGQREGVPRKPDPAGAVEAARGLGFEPGEVLYVGDTAVDMETGLRAGMRPIGVAWGFRPVEELWSTGAEAVIETPAELLLHLQD
jgi:phosphoglycolate phosphatase